MHLSTHPFVIHTNIHTNMHTILESMDSPTDTACPSRISWCPLVSLWLSLDQRPRRTYRFYLWRNDSWKKCRGERKRTNQELAVKIVSLLSAQITSRALRQIRGVVQVSYYKYESCCHKGQRGGLDDRPRRFALRTRCLEGGR